MRVPFSELSLPRLAVTLPHTIQYGTRLRGLRGGALRQPGSLNRQLSWQPSGCQQANRHRLIDDEHDTDAGHRLRPYKARVRENFRPENPGVKRSTGSRKSRQD